jgi:hypothetical protein
VWRGAWRACWNAWRRSTSTKWGRHYLNRVYGECNALPLADVEKGQRQPRLQRVFVDVRVRDAVPTYEQVMARLGLFDYRRARAGRLVQAAFSARGDERQRAIRAPKGMAAAMEGDAPWTPAVRQLDRETFAKLAEALGVKPCCVPARAGEPDAARSAGGTVGAAPGAAGRPGQR